MADDRTDDLGSLAQNARRTSLGSARTTLFVLSALQLAIGFFFVVLAGSNQPDAVGPDAADKKFELQVTGALLVGIGVVFLTLGLLIYKLPVASTVTALVLYVGLQLLSAMVDPESIAKGIIIKIFIIVALVKAVQAAVAYERESREMKRSADLDPV